jgi:hypothetical protein
MGNKSITKRLSAQKEAKKLPSISAKHPLFGLLDGGIFLCYYQPETPILHEI